MQQASIGGMAMRILAGFVGIVLTIFLLGTLLGGCASIDKTGATQVAVIRNGGPFDSKTIREVVGPASSFKIPGIWSAWHKYIAGMEVRYYKVTSDPSLGDNGGFDFVRVPTSDGVRVGLDATITFKTKFTDEAGNLTPCEAPDCNSDEYTYLVEQFDDQYGNRKFSDANGDSHNVWEGNDGWNAFLNTLFRPVVENSFREQIGTVNCADLVSSCSLVQSTNVNAGAVPAVQAKDTAAAFEKIQTSVQDQIESGVTTQLGAEYLTDFHVQFTKVDLPEKVDNAIDDAQASFAKISEARAKKIQAGYTAQANQLLAKSYNNNPNLAYVNAIDSISKSGANVTVVVGNPGTGFVLGK
jgi:hypothetical protein